MKIKTLMLTAITLSLFGCNAQQDLELQFENAKSNYEKKIAECRVQREQPLKASFDNALGIDQIKKGLMYYSALSSYECHRPEIDEFNHSVKKLLGKGHHPEMERLNNYLDLYEKEQDRISTFKTVFEAMPEQAQELLKPLNAVKQPFDPAIELMKIKQLREQQVKS